MAEEKLNDIEIFGRKIFFINPAYAVRNDIIKDLQNKEYEIYVIDNYHEAKNLLRLNQNSLLFINVDAQLPVSSWYNYIRSYEKEEVLRTIHITIMSERIKQSDRILFENAPECQGGVLNINNGTEIIAREIQAILDKTNAKGKRQYIRANLFYDRDASLFWNYGQKMHQLKLLDISSVGMAVKVPAQISNLVTKNTVLRDVTLKLGTKQFLVEAVVFAIKQENDMTNWILLLSKTSTQIKETIRAYISFQIQKTMMATINGDTLDDSDYAVLNYYSLATKEKTKKPISSSPGFSNQPGFNN